jgi:hypothetical protein
MGPQDKSEEVQCTYRELRNSSSQCLEFGVFEDGRTSTDLLGLRTVLLDRLADNHTDLLSTHAVLHLLLQQRLQLLELFLLLLHRTLNLGLQGGQLEHAALQLILLLSPVIAQLTLFNEGGTHFVGSCRDFLQ